MVSLVLQLLLGQLGVVPGLPVAPDVNKPPLAVWEDRRVERGR